MKIALFGINGQVGWELNRSLLPLGEIVPLGRSQADLSDPESLRKVIRTIHPDIVVNAAAYTNVEKAESEPDLAHRVNCLSPGVIAEECDRLGALLLHYSTDYVFNGASAAPYLESEEPAPLNVYGASKLEGEVAVRQACARHLIVRCGWVYASRGGNFVRTMCKLMQDRDELSVVDDQVGSPTWARFIADSSMCMIRNVVSEDNTDVENRLGIFHLSSAGSCSWYEFSLAILEHLKIRGLVQSCEIKPVPSEAYRTEAERPRYSVMDNSRVVERHHIEQVPWRDALSLCLDEVCGRD